MRTVPVYLEIAYGEIVVLLASEHEHYGIIGWLMLIGPDAQQHCGLLPDRQVPRIIRRDAVGTEDRQLREPLSAPGGGDRAGKYNNRCDEHDRNAYGQESVHKWHLLETQLHFELHCEALVFGQPRSSVPRCD